MSRNLVKGQTDSCSDPELTLEEYADLYIKRKKELDALTKETEAINKRMKELMVEQDQTEAHCSLGVVSYVVQQRPKFNEEMALSILKASGHTESVKTKEYIDMDMLEGQLYNEELPTEVVKELEKCTTTKQVPTLTISKKKG